uniref:Uncharacterized protein n=1 Tax=Molossus molossus TaxID=27622 RepID=A0A7J8DC31_MOLMO|nr:hypothetical protein HJG59_009322 [Molossus molossus]
MRVNSFPVIPVHVATPLLEDPAGGRSISNLPGGRPEGTFSNQLQQCPRPRAHRHSPDSPTLSQLGPRTGGVPCQASQTSAEEFRNEVDKLQLQHKSQHTPVINFFSDLLIRTPWSMKFINKVPRRYCTTLNVALSSTKKKAKIESLSF